MDLYSDLDSYVSIITKRAELPRDVPWFISFYFTKFWINERCISMEVWGNKAYHKSALTPFFLPAHVKCAHVHVNYNARCTSTVGFLFCPCAPAAARARYCRRAAPRRAALSRTSSPLLLPPDSALARAHCTTTTIQKKWRKDLCLHCTAMLRTTVNV